MSTAYEPNIQGAIAVLRDLMIANSFTMTREPYEPNYRGLVDAVIDLKEGFPTFAPLQVGFDATAFENVSEGDALYMSCLLYTSPSPRDKRQSRMPSSA